VAITGTGDVQEGLIDAAVSDAAGGTQSEPDANCPRFKTLALFFVVSVGRFAFSLDRNVFAISPDEPANLAMARWLAGQGHWNMFTSATYRPGLATLLTPLFWLADDQNIIIRSAFLFAALCGGASAVLLAHLARRLTDISWTGAILAAGTVALLPAGLSASAHVWAEPLVTLLFLGTLCLLIRFLDHPRLRVGLAAVALSAASYTAHGRMFALFAVVVCVVCGVFVVNHRWRHAVVVASTSAALGWATALYANLFYDNLWTDPGEFNTFASVASRLTDPVEVVRSGLGQLWYLLTSTIGIFGIGMAVAVAGAIGARDDRRTRDLRLVIAITLPLLALSAVFMSNRGRVDQLVYGRYNDAVVWPLLIVGIAGLAGLPAGRWSDLPRWMRSTILGIALAMLEAGMVVEITLRGRNRQQVEFVDMIAGLAPVLGGADRLPVVWITLGAAAIFGLTVVIVLRSGDRARTLVATVCMLLVLVAGLATRDAMDFAAPDLGHESRAVRNIEGRELPAGVEVVYGFVPELLDPGVGSYMQGYYSQLYQWYLPDHQFRLTASGDYGSRAYVFAPLHDRILEDSNACVLWQDPAISMALWFSNPDCPP